MEILYLLIPLSVMLVFVIGFFFFRSLKSGQFEDMEGPAYRILMDDDNPAPSSEQTAPKKQTTLTSKSDRFDPDQDL
jgi:cbb3-type cytochrome oxidase maturation protein